MYMGKYVQMRKNTMYCWMKLSQLLLAFYILKDTYIRENYFLYTIATSRKTLRNYYLMCRVMQKY